MTEDVNKGHVDILTVMAQCLSATPCPVQGLVLRLDFLVHSSLVKELRYMDEHLIEILWFGYSSLKSYCCLRNVLNVMALRGQNCSFPCIPKQQKHCIHAYGSCLL